MGNIVWNSANYVKLLAAVLAAHPELKPKYAQIAVFFGEGTTYDAIEGCMRPIRRRAQALREEVEGGDRADIPPAPSKQTPKKRKRGADDLSSGDEHQIEVIDLEELKTSPSKKAKINSVAAAFVTASSSKTRNQAGKGRGAGKKKKQVPVTSIMDHLLTVWDSSDNDETSRPLPEDVKIVENHSDDDIVGVHQLGGYRSSDDEWQD